MNFAQAAKVNASFTRTENGALALIDTEYRSLKDEYFLAVYATRDIVIESNTRLAQFTIFKNTDFSINEEEYWEEAERGGFGSTGN